MKYYMKLLVLFLVLMLSGCTIEYDLEFNNNTLSENINVYLQGSDYQLNNINNLKGLKPYAISSGLDQEPYAISFKDTGTEFIANYRFNFSVNNFYKTHALKSCYDAFAFTEAEEHYLLSTSKIFKCLLIDYASIDGVKIRIKTNHKVLEHNADYIEDNTYIWNIDNPQQLTSVEKPILIKFSKALAEDNSIFNNDIFIVGMFIIGIALIGGIIFAIAYIKNIKNNWE